MTHTRCSLMHLACTAAAAVIGLRAQPLLQPSVTCKSPLCMQSAVLMVCQVVSSCTAGLQRGCLCQASMASMGPLLRKPTGAAWSMFSRET